MREAISTFFSCNTARDKAVSLSVLSAFSLIVAVTIDYLYHLVAGPTSLGSLLSIYSTGFFFVCGFLISAFVVFRHTLKTKPEGLFLLIVLSTTCFSSLAFDVNKPSWDMDVHYRVVATWSEPDLEVELSAADAKMIYGWTWESFFNLAELKSYSEELNQDAKIEDGRVITDSIASLYKRISSLPASLIFAFCTLLGAPFSSKYVLARLVYALIYSLVAYAGMRQLKSGKMLYAVIALLPTALFIASNYGYDYWINAFVLLGGACLVRELQTPDKMLTKKRAVLLLGSFIIGFGPKVIYAPVILLCLLIPKKKFQTVAGSRLFRGGVILACFFTGLTFLIPYAFSMAGVSSGGGDMRGGSDVNAAQQIAYVLSNPLEYLQNLVSFLLGEYYAFANSRNYIAFFAYLGNSSWPIWIGIFALMLFTAITDKTDADKTVCTWRSRVLAIAVHAITIMLIATALYIDYTPVGQARIEGVQARYLIPLLYCTLVFLGSCRFAWPRVQDTRKTLYNGIILGAMTVAYLVSFWQVYIGHLH